MIESIYTQMEFWHWLTIAVVFIILEILSPGVFFLWLGLASAGVGIVMSFLPQLSWQSQFFLLACFSISSIILWRLFRKYFPPQEAEVSHLNRRAEQYLGRSFTLVEPIVNGTGKIKVDDSTWRVKGEEAPLGTQVKIIGVDGIVFDTEILKKTE
ncbi:MAG: NfeD family protein [gamma proteobacterium symbiont of Taylorina sp.]|nr:NfeD family protein [gamma proteobacterium symbiont of Taylorina sp.]